MNFRTRIDFTNRQAKQYEKTDISLSGSSLFGLPYNLLTSGPNLTLSAVTYEDAALQSTYSGNTGATVYTFSDSRMTIDEGDLSALTPSNSGLTQYAGPTWAGYNMFTTADGYTGWTAYSAVTYDIVVVTMVDLGAGAYSGIVQSDFIVYSAETLDYSGRTIWVDVSGITRTNDLIVTNTPVIGYVLTCYDNEGKATWQPTTGGTTGATIWTAGTGTGSAVLAGSGGIGGIGAVSEGFKTVASGRYSHSEGHMSRAAGDGSHAEGGTSTGSISGGTAIGNGSHAEGGLTIASGAYSHAEGYQTSGTTTHTHSEGYQTIASADASHAEGYQTSATATYAHSEGYRTIASGNSSHSEGYESIAGGTYSHAEGFQTTASNVSSHAEGRLTIASGAYSHAEGYQTYATSTFTHAEGYQTSATTSYAHSEGYQTIASANAAHAEGSGTTASGVASHAGGAVSTASGITSFVHSYNSSANANNSAILGGNNFLIESGSINSILLGGSYNTISATTTYGGIICGFDHVLSGGSKSVILGGDNNKMNASTSIIVGGSSNEIKNGTGDASGSFIGSTSNGLISDGGGTLIGGGYNSITGAGGALIIGGVDNLISGGSTNIIINSSGCTISGVTNTAIIGGNGIGISGVVSNMVYVPDLTIDGLTSVDPIATDSTGKIVAGVSDARLKTNITDLSSALDKILKLRGVSYEWTEASNMGAGVTKFGFIAQEVQEVIPEMVRARSKGDGMLSLSYTELVPFIIEAIKELASGSTKINENNITINTQTIASEDNNIELNYNGNHTTALGGGITLLNAVRDGVHAEIKADENGRWIVTPSLVATKLSIPEHTPTSTNDEMGSTGDMVWDDQYIYIKRNNGWGRSKLENF